MKLGGTSCGGGTWKGLEGREWDILIKICYICVCVKFLNKNP